MCRVMCALNITRTALPPTLTGTFRADEGREASEHEAFHWAVLPLLRNIHNISFTTGTIDIIALTLLWALHAQRAASARR